MWIDIEKEGKPKGRIKGLIIYLDDESFGSYDGKVWRYWREDFRDWVEVQEEIRYYMVIPDLPK